MADRIEGPYLRHGPLFKTGNHGLLAPGGADIASNGNHRTSTLLCSEEVLRRSLTEVVPIVIWHADWGGGRAAFTAIVRLHEDKLAADQLE